MGSERIIGVVGTGTMGKDIAQAAAITGFAVKLLGSSVERATRAQADIADALAARVTQGTLAPGAKEEAVQRLQVVGDARGLADAECVIEAAPEQLPLKRSVFAGLDAAVSPRTLLATNTSTLSIAKIAQGLRSADRVVGLHFFNPAVDLQVVELVSGLATSEQALVWARSVCAKLGKTPVKVKDSPGLIGSRVSLPLFLESLRLLEGGEADVRTIDAAMCSVGGFAAGPFRRLDSVGLDESLRLTEAVYQALEQPARFAPTPSATLTKLVSAGYLGRKTRRGFYDYSDSQPFPAYEVRVQNIAGWRPSPALCEFARAIERPADRATWLFARMFLAVLNEAALAADSIALPRDVDLTLELGLAYPEGPLGLADRIGLDVIHRLLVDFAVQPGGQDRYRPSPLLERLIQDGHLGEKTARGFLYHAL